MSRGRWDFYDAPPRRSVEGGVVVAKPGKVSDSLFNISQAYGVGSLGRFFCA